MRCGLIFSSDRFDTIGAMRTAQKSRFFAENDVKDRVLPCSYPIAIDTYLQPISMIWAMSTIRCTLNGYRTPWYNTGNRYLLPPYEAGFSGSHSSTKSSIGCHCSLETRSPPLEHADQGHPLRRCLNAVTISRRRCTVHGAAWTLRRGDRAGSRTISPTYFYRCHRRAKALNDRQ